MPGNLPGPARCLRAPRGCDRSGDNERSTVSSPHGSGCLPLTEDTVTDTRDTDNPADDLLARRLRTVVEELRREREARKPPLLKSDATSRIRPSTPQPCPFSHELLTYRFGFTGIPLTAEETERCIAGRQHIPQLVLERVTVPCAPTLVTVPAGLALAYPVALMHVDLLIEERSVHIEVIGQTLGSPGGGNREVRIYVDQLLEGRSILLGRLGATVNNFPAVAAIGKDLVVTVEPVHWNRFDEIIVDLRQRTANSPPHEERS